MNKLTLSIFAIVVLLAVWVGVRHYQTQKIEQTFKDSIINLPQNMQKYMPLLNNKEIKQDILVVYPTLFFYMDVKTFKEKKAPKEFEEKILEEGNWMCMSFFRAIEPELSQASAFERKTVLKFLKTERITVDVKLRNAFAEPLYHQTQVLADCPQYHKALYND